MKKRNRNQKSILFLLLAVVLLGGGIFVGVNWNNWFGEKPATEAKQPKQELDTGASDWTGRKEEYTGEKNTDTIDIPGFDTMSLKAGETAQSVNLYNPEQNTCYFKMTISLPDGTTLWESDLIEPGKGLYEIELNQALEAGTYENAVLKYECFTLDEAQSPLNGAEVKFTINVLE